MTPIPRLLQRRIDALVLAFKVAPCTGVEARIRSRWEEAARSRAGVELSVYPPSWDGRAILVELCPSRSAERWNFRSDDVRGVWDKDATHGWTLEVVVSATYLATHSLEQAIELARAFASGFGTVYEERTRRIDEAADFAGWSFLEGDDKALLTCRTTKRTRFAEVDAEDERRRVHRAKRGYRITGISVSPAGMVHLRVYDKLEELELPGRERKREIELQAYRRAGWDGSERVVRVEFQLRGKVLDELDLRDPSRLADRLDPVWQYLTKRWCRMIIPGTATRDKRCKLDPRWTAVQAVQFRHEAAPAERKRVRRGGASAAQTLGCMLSLLGGLGALPHREIIHDEDGVILTESEVIATWPDARAELATRKLVRRVALDAADAILAELFARHEMREAAGLAFARLGGARARFSSVDDPLYQAVG